MSHSKVNRYLESSTTGMQKKASKTLTHWDAGGTCPRRLCGFGDNDVSIIALHSCAIHSELGFLIAEIGDSHRD